MKIAKLFIGDPNNQKGFFNNVMERTKNLIEKNQDVDCYLIRLEPGLLMRCLKKDFKKIPKEPYTIINNIKLNNIWIQISLLDYIFTYRLNLKITPSSKQLKKLTYLFEEYDLLSTHGVEANYVAMNVRKKFNIPFVTTWHGSDINIRAFKNKLLGLQYKNQMNEAFHNFFVSKRLLDKSKQLTQNNNKSVLYTGPSTSFYRYPLSTRQELRSKLRIDNDFVVGYIGNFREVKNVLALPEIFHRIQKEVSNVSFIVVGDGPMESQLLAGFDEYKIKNLHILGRQKVDNMPNIVNCLDVLVLPSLNEGLPRVTLEAQACGVHVVGSNRGGIPEAIGMKNCFELNSNFPYHVASRVIELLSAKNLAYLPDKFSSVSSADIEIQTHEQALSR